MLTKDQLHTLHAIQDDATAAGDKRLYYAIDLAISAGLNISEPYHQNAVKRAVEYNAAKQ